MVSSRVWEPQKLNRVGTYFEKIFVHYWKFVNLKYYDSWAYVVSVPLIFLDGNTLSRWNVTIKWIELWKLIIEVRGTFASRKTAMSHWWKSSKIESIRIITWAYLWLTFEDMSSVRHADWKVETIIDWNCCWIVLPKPTDYIQPL